MELDNMYQAIELLKNHTQYYVPVEDIWAFNMAVDALEKICEFVCEI